MLVKLSTLLNMEGKSDKPYAVGSFSIINIETILGTIKAAEEMNTPIIMQIAEPRLKHMPLELIGPAMVLAAKNANVPVCVHFDHGKEKSLISQAIEIGFTSVMIDASHYSFKENVAITKEICNLAHNFNVDCEGEIGQLGYDEEGTKLSGAYITGVLEAKSFAEETGVDALAVAIGNQHGLHTDPPKLNMDRLLEIYKATTVPLVLHGGSGTTVEEFKKCIQNGIRKINVASATLDNIMINSKLYFDEGNMDYFGFHDRVINSAFESVCKHIKIFNNKE